MGQQNCCQSDPINKELILHFNSLKTEDPIQTSVPTNLKKSLPTNILISRRGFQDGIDGDYLTQQPMMTKAVLDRLENLRTILVYQNRFIEYSSIRSTSTGQLIAHIFQVQTNWYHICWLMESKPISNNLQNKVPNGFGKNYYPNGGLYEGGFIQGIPHGFGRFIMPNGDYYQGQVKYGRANGSGVFQSQDSRYKGMFKDNVRHGRGQQKGKNFYFQGQFEYGQKKSGLLKYQDNVYEGQFLDGQFHGKGMLTTSEGVYQGVFKTGQRQGYGQFKWINGSFYRGNYHKGTRQGFGQYFNGKNSSISKGMWRKGVLNGEGQYTQPRGEVHKVIWSEGTISAIVGN